MLIRTYVHQLAISSNYNQYMAWGIHDCDGYGCFFFKKDPNSVGLASRKATTAYMSARTNVSTETCA